MLLCLHPPVSTFQCFSTFRSSLTLFDGNPYRIYTAIKPRISQVKILVLIRLFSSQVLWSLHYYFFARAYSSSSALYFYHPEAYRQQRKAFLSNQYSQKLIECQEEHFLLYMKMLPISETSGAIENSTTFPPLRAALVSISDISIMISFFNYSTPFYKTSSLTIFTGLSPILFLVFVHFRAI